MSFRAFRKATWSAKLDSCRHAAVHISPLTHKIPRWTEKAFRAIREYRLLHGESKALHADPSVVSMPEGYRAVVRQIPLIVYGRAAALTNGRVADGALTMTELGVHERESIVLGNHDAFRIVAATLEPVRSEERRVGKECRL